MSDRWQPKLESLMERTPAAGGLAKERWRNMLCRMAWLAEVVLAIDGTTGFPGGCPGQGRLGALHKGNQEALTGRMGYPSAAAGDQTIDVAYLEIRQMLTATTITNFVSTGDRIRNKPRAFPSGPRPFSPNGGSFQISEPLDFDQSPGTSVGRNPALNLRQQRSGSPADHRSHLAD